MNADEFLTRLVTGTQLNNVFANEWINTQMIIYSTTIEWLNVSFKYFYNNLGHEVDDLHGTDEREAREEPHGASDSGELVHQLGCTVLKTFYELIKI